MDKIKRREKETARERASIQYSHWIGQVVKVETVLGAVYSGELVSEDAYELVIKEGGGTRDFYKTIIRDVTSPEIKPAVEPADRVGDVVEITLLSGSKLCGTVISEGDHTITLNKNDQPLKGFLEVAKCGVDKIEKVGKSREAVVVKEIVTEKKDVPLENRPRKVNWRGNNNNQQGS